MEKNNPVRIFSGMVALAFVLTSVSVFGGDKPGENQECNVKNRKKFTGQFEPLESKIDQKSEDGKAPAGNAVEGEGRKIKPRKVGV